MLILTRVVVDLGYFGLGNLSGVCAAHPFPLRMNVQHDPDRIFAVEREKMLQHVNDEFHGRVVGVQEHHVIKRWLLELRFCLIDDNAVVVMRMLWKVISHRRILAYSVGAGALYWLELRLHAHFRDFVQIVH